MLIERIIRDAEAPHDPDSDDRGFEAGLARLLDGFAVVLPKQAGRAAKQAKGPKRVRGGRRDR